MVSKRIVSKGIPANEGAGKTALITGASSGIGEAIAARLAQAGYNLVLVARSADKLKALAKELSEQYQVKVWSAPADLFDREAPAKLLAAMKRARRPIDFLVNCAGVLEHADFVGMSPARRFQILIPRTPLRLAWNIAALKRIDGIGLKLPDIADIAAILKASSPATLSEPE